MVQAYHLVFCTYGFWLPNDPRGSGSKYVGAADLRQFGQATYLPERRRSRALKPHDTQLRQLAKKYLKFSEVKLNGLQARAVGTGFATYVKKAQLQVWACSILPDHVHLVIARHRLTIEKLSQKLKAEASWQLLEEGIHPLSHLRSAEGKLPTCWGRDEWKVFLNTEAEIQARIRYVENNPLKDGKPKQKWSFVTPFDGL